MHSCASVLSQAVCISCGLDGVRTLVTIRERLYKHLFMWYVITCGLKNMVSYYKSCVLIKLLNSGMNAQALKAILMTENILIRDCSNYPGLNDSFIRIAVKSCSENNILLKNLNAIFGAELG